MRDSDSQFEASSTDFGLGAVVCNLRDRGLRYEHVFFRVLVIVASNQQTAGRSFPVTLVGVLCLSSEDQILRCYLDGKRFRYSQKPLGSKKRRGFVVRLKTQA